MHLSKDKVGNVRHLIENRFGKNLREEIVPHLRYDGKSGESVENGTIRNYYFENNGRQFKLEIIEKEKVLEHEKLKDGRVVGRTYESVPGEFTYDLELYSDDAGDWKKMDLDVGEMLG